MARAHRARGQELEGKLEKEEVSRKTFRVHMCNSVRDGTFNKAMRPGQG